jgi:hypothetical protein
MEFDGSEVPRTGQLLVTMMYAAAAAKIHAP